jgi:hypothetical protein
MPAAQSDAQQRRHVASTGAGGGAWDEERGMDTWAAALNAAAGDRRDIVRARTSAGIAIEGQAEGRCTGRSTATGGATRVAAGQGEQDGEGGGEHQRAPRRARAAHGDHRAEGELEHERRL